MFDNRYTNTCLNRVVILRQIAYIKLMGFYAGVKKADDVPVAVAREKQLMDVDELALVAGVRPGQTVRQGRLVCPELVVFPYDEAEYRLPSRRHLDVYARHTPFVEPEGYHGCYLDLSGSLPAREELESIVGRVVPELAWGAAVGLAGSRFLARVAAGGGGPGCQLVIVPPGGEVEFLTGLPVACLWPLAPELRQRLLLLGLKTVGQVRMIPAAELARRFGKEGRLLASLIRGADPTPVRARYPEEVVEFRLSLSDEATVEGALLASLDAVTGGLARGLAERLAGACRLALILEHADGRCTFLERELARPRCSYKSLREQLAGLVRHAGPIPGVTALRVEAGALMRLSAEQLTLGCAREDTGKWTRLGVTMESLARKYRGTVVEAGSRRPPDHREAMLDLYDPMRRSSQWEGW